jgi:hypothetical protein
MFNIFYKAIFMNYLITLFYASLFCFTSLAAMEMEHKEEVERKRSAVPTLFEITARYIAAKLCNPMNNEEKALSFLASDNALNDKAKEKVVQELAYDAVEQLEKIFPNIPKQLQEKKEITCRIAKEICTIHSLDKKWWAYPCAGSIEMGNDMASKSIQIPLARGFERCQVVRPVAISKDNRICLASGFYTKNTGDILNEFIGVDYEKEKIIYRYPLFLSQISKDHSFFVGNDDNSKVKAYSLENGAFLYQLAVPDCNNESKITLGEKNKHILINIGKKLYVCNSVTGELIRTLSVEENINDYRLSNNECSVATLDDDKILVWDVDSGNKVCSITNGDVSSIGDGFKLVIREGNTSYQLNGFDANDRFLIWNRLTKRNYITADEWPEEGEGCSYSCLVDLVKKKWVAEKFNPRPYSVTSDKNFIYQHIAQTLTLKELIALLMLEKKLQQKMPLDKNLLEIIKRSQCGWLKDSVRARYEPWLCSIM